MRLSKCVVTIHVCDGKEKIGTRTGELGVREYRGTAMSINFLTVKSHFHSSLFQCIWNHSALHGSNCVL